MRERAVAALSRREHSRAELAAKLRRYTDDRDEIAAVLDELVASKLLSDERYAEARAHALSRKFGAARIAHDLKRSGVADETIAQVTAEAQASDLERARSAWRKRFGTPPANLNERAKQQRFLQSRGFSHATIRTLLRGIDDDLAS